MKTGVRRVGSLGRRNARGRTVEPLRVAIFTRGMLKDRSAAGTEADRLDWAVASLAGVRGGTDVGLGTLAGYVDARTVARSETVRWGVGGAEISGGIGEHWRTLWKNGDGILCLAGSDNRSCLLFQGNDCCGGCFGRIETQSPSPRKEERGRPLSILPRGSPVHRVCQRRKERTTPASRRRCER